MKLANLGIRFVVDSDQVESPSSNRPTKLYFNGRPSYVLLSSKWGFVLEPEDDMLTHMLASSTISTAFKRRDLIPIIVDCPGFSELSAVKKMIAVRNALLGRVSDEQAAFAAGAINWWVDQVLEKDSQSP